MHTQITRLSIALILTAIALSACSDEGRADPAIPGAPEITVVATDLRFSPSEFTIPSAQANLTLRNDGAIKHDLTVADLRVHLVAAPGQRITTGLRGLRPGRYSAICTVQGHADAGMRLTVVVD